MKSVAREVLLAAMVGGALGCDSAAPPAPSAAPVLGMDWGRAASVEKPANFLETVAPSYVGVHPILRSPVRR